jgi:glycosyltransferase involved in cell wall biosynthesis
VYGSGVVSYTKNLVCGLKDLGTGIEIHVVADKNPGLQEEYMDDGVIVHRVFEKKASYFLRIFKILRKIKPHIVHIQHEYFLYGGVFSAILFPLLILLSRVVSYKVVVTFHGVLPLKLLDDSKFREENGIEGPLWLLKIGLLIVTKLISSLAHAVVVHGPLLQENLVGSYGVDRKKVIVIPHGVYEIELTAWKDAKRKLGLQNKKIILFFGYLTGYKGLDLLIEAFGYIIRKIPEVVLIIAGGEHPRLKDSPNYRKYLEDLKAKARGISKNIIFTGFVPENEIPLYFSAADLVVFPYKFATSIGPLSIVCSYRKPFLVSETLKKAFNFPDEIAFKENPTSLALKIENFFSSSNFHNNKNYYEKIISNIKEERSWSKISYKTFMLYKKLLLGNRVINLRNIQLRASTKTS